MATYAKGLARRASLTESSTRAAKSYKVKVASLTSERVGLRAQIRDLIEELVKHRSDVKHASTARVQAKDKEKKARKNAKVAEDELRLAREELQAVKVTCVPKCRHWTGFVRRLWRLGTPWNA